MAVLFASTTSEDSIALFRLYLQERGSRVRIVEVPVHGDILYEWSYSNLEQSIQGGYQEADKVVKGYRPRMGLVSPVTTLVRRVSSWSERAPNASTQDAGRLQSRDPDSVIPMVVSDLCAFTSELPKYMVLARQAMEGRELSSALTDMHVGHRATIGLIEDDLEEVDESSMQAKDYEDVHTAANAIKLLQEIDRSLQDMVATIVRHSGEIRLMQFIEVAVDAIDVLLLTLGDAARSQLEADRVLLRKITTDRTDVLRRFRESYFPEGTDVSSREAAGLLSIGDQFDAIVRLAGQYEGLLNSSWSGARFTAQQDRLAAS
jgi:hypothetical protein